MLLKSDEIVHALSGEEDPFGRLRIVPSPSFEEIRSSGSASVDLRLGRWFLQLREGRTALLDPSKRDSRDEESSFPRTVFVRFGDRFILHPRKFILGITLEWLKLPSRIGGYVTGKSSWGRRGLVIETAAGIHPGFSGCLTLELGNMGEVPVALIPGMRICQIFLHTAGEGDAVHGGQFLGRRRPTLGDLAIDPVVEALAENL